MSNKECIVKVQQSLAHHDPNNPDAGQQVLVYDEEREFMYEGPLPDELKELMGDRPKVYCKAELVPDLDQEKQPTGTFKFAIVEEVEAQPW